MTVLELYEYNLNESFFSTIGKKFDEIFKIFNVTITFIQIKNDLSKIYNEIKQFIEESQKNGLSDDEIAEELKKKYKKEYSEGEKIHNGLKKAGLIKEDLNHMNPNDFLVNQLNQLKPLSTLDKIEIQGQIKNIHNGLQLMKTVGPENAQKIIQYSDSFGIISTIMNSFAPLIGFFTSPLGQGVLAITVGFILLYFLKELIIKAIDKLVDKIYNN